MCHFFPPPFSFLSFQDSSGNGFDGTLKSDNAGTLPTYDGSSINLASAQQNNVEIPAAFATYLNGASSKDFTLQVLWNPTTVSKLIDAYG